MIIAREPTSCCGLSYLTSSRTTTFFSGSWAISTIDYLLDPSEWFRGPICLLGRSGNTHPDLNETPLPPDGYFQVIAPAPSLWHTIRQAPVSMHPSVLYFS